MTYEIQMLVSINKVLLATSYSHFLYGSSMASFKLQLHKAQVASLDPTEEIDLISSI